MNNELGPKIMLNCNVAGAYHKSCPKKLSMDKINTDMRSLKINAELASD